MACASRRTRLGVREGAADPDRAVGRSRVRRRGPGRNESLRTGGCGSVAALGVRGIGAEFSVAAQARGHLPEATDRPTSG